MEKTKKNDYMLITTLKEVQKEFSPFFSGLFRWCQDPECWECSVNLGNEIYYFLEDAKFERTKQIQEDINFLIRKMEAMEDVYLLEHLAKLKVMKHKLEIGLTNHELYFRG